MFAQSLGLQWGCDAEAPREDVPYLSIAPDGAMWVQEEGAESSHTSGQSTWLQVPSPLPLAATIAHGSAFSATEFPAMVPHEMMAGWGGRD